MIILGLPNIQAMMDRVEDKKCIDHPESGIHFISFMFSPTPTLDHTATIITIISNSWYIDCDPIHHKVAI